MDHGRPLDEPMVVYRHQIPPCQKLLAISYFILSVSEPLPHLDMDVLKTSLKYCIIGLASTIYATCWLLLVSRV